MHFFPVSAETGSSKGVTSLRSVFPSKSMRKPPRSNLCFIMRLSHDGFNHPDLGYLRLCDAGC